MRKRFVRCLVIFSSTLLLSSCSLSGCSMSEFLSSLFNGSDSDSDSDTNTAENTTSLSFNYDVYELRGFESLQLQLYDDENNLVDFSAVSLHSSNSEVASVTNDGLVTANNIEGSAVITASLGSNLSITATCTIYVSSVVLLESIETSVESLTLIVGESSKTFSYTFSPSNADVSDFNIYVEDVNIASIDDDLNVTGLEKGSTKVIIESNEFDNYVSASIDVYVYDESDIVLTSTTDMTEAITYQELNQTIDYGGIPSVTEGDETNVLVIPINFTDYSFSSYYGLSDTQVINQLDVVFNGDGKDDTGYWESVSSYFYKSSNGKLNLNFDIGDIYTSSITATTLKNSSTAYTDKPLPIFQEAINEYENNEFDFNKYDNDNDGDIDGVWFVYSAPNYQNNYSLYDGNSTFWAYVYYDYYNQVRTSSSQPDLNKYGWASFDFLYQTYLGKGYDTHTYIHETGHLLGLNDYYDYNSQSAPLGCFDMQDYNVGDHNARSKAALGWVEPVLYDVSSNPLDKAYVTISKDTPLFITNEYHDTVFDEFIIFEFYTPGGLNELDATYAYSSIGRMPNATGVKVLHADCRLINGSGSYVYSNYSSYFNNSFNYLVLGAANSTDRTYTGYDQLTMISSNPNGGDFLSRRTGWTANDLFYEEDEFNLDTYTKLSSNKATRTNSSGKLNNGSSLDVNVTVEEIGDDYATLLIEKI